MAHMMVQALLPGCSTTQEATNQSEARRSKVPPVMSSLSRQYVAPAAPQRVYGVKLRPHKDAPQGLPAAELEYIVSAASKQIILLAGGRCNLPPWSQQA